MNLEAILDDCLVRLQQGESVAECLERYSLQAAELAPLLATADQLRILSAQQLSIAQRQAGKRALRQALAAQQEKVQPAFGLGWLSWLRSPVAVPLAALLLLVVLAGGAVAASQPGDLAYGARVAIERATVWRFWDAGQRAAAELTVAERRLSDVERAWQQTAQVNATAIQALLRGDEAAAEMVAPLAIAERHAVAERIEAHAANLASLSAVAADEVARRSLLLAVTQLQRIAERLRTRLEPSGEPGGQPTASPPVRGSAVPPRPTTASLEPTPPAETPSPTVVATPAPTLTRHPGGPWSAATAMHPPSPEMGTHIGRPTAVETMEPTRPSPGVPPTAVTRRAEQTAAPPHQPTSAVPGASRTVEPPRERATSAATPRPPAPTVQAPGNGSGSPSHTPASPGQPRSTPRERP